MIIVALASSDRCRDVMLTIESAASEAKYVPVLPWSVRPVVAFDVWCILPRPPCSESSTDGMPVPLSSTTQLPRPKFTDMSTLLASASKAFSSGARITPDRLVICFEEVIPEMASSESGRIRAGIGVATAFCQTIVQNWRSSVTAVSTRRNGSWLRLGLVPTSDHVRDFCVVARRY
jgi:hypothetical protein